jgi:Peptidase_C39 like family
MSSVIAMVLLFVVMLLIVASLLIGVWQEKRRFKRSLGLEARLSPHAIDRRRAGVLSARESNLISVVETKNQSFSTLPSSWYNRRRSFVSLGFLLMVFLTLSVQSGLAGGTIQTVTKGLAFTFHRPDASTDIQPIAHPILLTASARLMRIDSADRSQYYTDEQWRSWSYSSCSGMAMAMVMNSYGRRLIAADVLQEEANLGVWNVSLGLLRDDGIGMTAAYYGFDNDTSHSRTLQEVIAIANKGNPVIVSVRDSYYFPGGHIFVVRGGDGQYVSIADSSPGNFTRMSYAMLQGMWQGLSVVLTPHKQ